MYSQSVANSKQSHRNIEIFSVFIQIFCAVFEYYTLSYNQFGYKDHASSTVEGAWDMGRAHTSVTHPRIQYSDLLYVCGARGRDGEGGYRVCVVLTFRGHLLRYSDLPYGWARGCGVGGTHASRTPPRVQWLALQVGVRVELTFRGHILRYSDLPCGWGVGVGWCSCFADTSSGTVTYPVGGVGWGGSGEGSTRVSRTPPRVQWLTPWVGVGCRERGEGGTHVSRTPPRVQWLAPRATRTRSVTDIRSSRAAPT